MKKEFYFMKLCLLSAFLVSVLMVKGQTLCDTNGCTANDLQVDSVFVADATGKIITDVDCIAGDTVQNVWLQIKFKGSTASPRYNLLAYFDLYQNDQFYTHHQICYNPPGGIVAGGYYTVVEISWICGSKLTLKNFYESWQASSNEPCGCGTSKCNFATEPINVYGPIFADFSAATECKPDESYQTVTFTSTTTGGTTPYHYAWDIGNPADYTIESGSVTSASVVATYKSTGDKYITLTITDSKPGTPKTDTHNDTVHIVSCFSIVTPAQPGNFECSDVSGNDNWLNTGGGTVISGGCLPVTWSHAPYTLSGGCASYTGSATIYFTGTDSCGKTVTTSALLTVYDSTSPTLTVPADVTVECDAVPSSGIATATDNCDPVVQVSYEGQQKETGNCTDNYRLIRTWKATDDCGNSSTRSQTITVQDTKKPVLTIPDNVTVECDAVPSVGIATATDNCDAAVSVTYLGQQRVDGNCADNYILVRTWKAEDNCGNSDTRSQTITVQDTTPPEISLQAVCVYLSEYGQWALNDKEIFDITKNITDNCSEYKDLNINIFPRSFDCNDIGKPVSAVVTVTDLCGNISSDIIAITVADTLKPVALCQNVTRYLDKFGQAFVVPGEVNPGHIIGSNPEWAVTFNGLEGGSYDNCGITEMYLDKQLFTCADVGVNPVILTVIDPSKNTGFCTANITILDTIVPVITPGMNITMTVPPGVCSTKITYPEILVNDNCTATLVQTAGLGANGFFPLGTTVETWKVLDKGGFTALTSFTVTIKTYNAPPTLNDLADMTVKEDALPFEIPLSGISYGIDCIPQEILSVDGNTGNPNLLNVKTTYTNGESTGKLTITLFPNKYGEAIISVIVGDNGGNENGGYYKVQKNFKLTVLPVNDPPVATPIYEQYVTVPNALSVNVKSAFSDVDEDDVISLKVTKADGTPLPSWMQFNPEIGFLKGVPGLTNMGVTDIKVVASDKSGATAETTFKVVVLVPNASTIKSSVQEGSTPLTAGIRVVLFEKEGNMFKMVEQTMSNNNGVYYFYNMPNGTYLLKAEVTDNQLHPGLMNTYHLSTTSISQATSVVISTPGSYSGDIKMVQKELPVGNFKISGIVVRKTGKPDLLNQGIDPVGTPASGIDLVLKQNGVVVGNTVTAADGKYAFTGLPAGTYDVFVELSGYTQDNTRKILVDNANPVKDKVDFTIWTADNSYVITKIKNVGNEFGLTLYPNPTTGEVNIDFTWNNFRKVDVFVYNILGVEVLRNQYTAGKQIAFDISGQVPGIYLVKLNAEGRTIVKKLILDNR